MKTMRPRRYRSNAERIQCYIINPPGIVAESLEDVKRCLEQVTCLADLGPGDSVDIQVVERTRRQLDELQDI